MKNAISTAKRQNADFLRLARYFEKQALDGRKIDELPWLYLQAKEWEGLARTIGDVEFLKKAQETRDEFELLEYWTALGDRYDMSAVYKRSLASLEKRGVEQKLLADYYSILATFFQNAARYEQAEPLYKRALDIRKAVFGTMHLRIADSINDLAICKYCLNDFKGAESLYRQALKIYRQLKGDEHHLTANRLDNLAVCYRSTGKTEQAVECFRQALAIRTQVLGPDYPKTAYSLDNYAQLLHKLQHYDGAGYMFKKALKIWQKHYGVGHLHSAVCIHNLARLELDRGKPDKALPQFRQSLQKKK